MKKISLILLSAVLISSCVSKKDFAALQTEKTATEEKLLAVKTTLQKCLIQNEKDVANASNLAEQVKYLQEDKKTALKQVENLTVLTQSSSEGINNVIAQLSEKDKYINGVRDAMTQKDSINLAIKFQFN